MVYTTLPAFLIALVLYGVIGATTARAMRLAQLEIKGVYEPSRHDHWLEEFDWDGYREKYGNIQRLDRILIGTSYAGEAIYLRSLDITDALLAKATRLEKGVP